MQQRIRQRLQAANIEEKYEGEEEEEEEKLIADAASDLISDKTDRPSLCQRYDLI